MLDRYFRFIRLVSGHWIGRIGVILTTSSFVTLLLLELLRLAGTLTNAYAGLVTYLLLPPLFVFGLLLIPIGWRRLKKRTGRSGRDLIAERAGAEEAKGRFAGSRVFMTIGLLTAVNVVFLGGISAHMLSFMDTPRFCGTACHSVMNPEWVTYQQSPHARVKCVECHVGEGTEALIDSKLNGLWQIISVTFDLLEHPIPTPVHQLRPARETCEKCHWPDKFYGGRLKTMVHYDHDSLSTPRYTTLNLKVDAGYPRRGGIHWHIAEQNQVRYVSLRDEREEIIWVESRQPDGSFRRYTTPDLAYVSDRDAEVRVMDCVDCHNRATHIYENPEAAIDERIRLGLLDASLPFFKREALHALTGDFPDTSAALEGIENQLRGTYERRYPEAARTSARSIDSAVTVLRKTYARNVHPQMNITWGTYPSHIGHKGTRGCFRCHNRKMVDAQGRHVSDDCTLCHSILAMDSREPFRILQAADSTHPDHPMLQYLRDEFLEEYGE